MPAGLQSHRRMSLPQTALAASPSGQMANTRLIAPPHEPFCSGTAQRWSGGGVATEPAAQRGQGAEGPGGLLRKP